MNNEVMDATRKAKENLKSGLIAIGLMLVGGLLLVGAAYFWIMPIFEGEKPNVVLGLLLGVPGAIMEIVGDWMMLMHRFRIMREKGAAMRAS